jgi:hypothetical protein
MYQEFCVNLKAVISESAYGVKWKTYLAKHNRTLALSIHGERTLRRKYIITDLS